MKIIFVDFIDFFDFEKKSINSYTKYICSNTKTIKLYLLSKSVDFTYFFKISFFYNSLTQILYFFCVRIFNNLKKKFFLQIFKKVNKINENIYN